MRYEIIAEISCNDRGYPLFHKEDIDYDTVFFSNITIMGMTETNNILRTYIKEDFDIEKIDNMACIIKKEGF